MSLEDKICSACSGDEDPIEESKILDNLADLHEDWQVIENHQNVKEFDLKNLQETLEIVNKVGKGGGEPGPPPKHRVTLGKANNQPLNSKNGRPNEDDFIMAAKIDKFYSKNQD